MQDTNELIFTQEYTAGCEAYFNNVAYDPTMSYAWRCGWEDTECTTSTKNCNDLH